MGLAFATPLEQERFFDLDQERFFDLCEKITAITTKDGKGWIHPIKDWICGTTTSTLPPTETMEEVTTTTSTLPPTTTTEEVTTEKVTLAPPTGGKCYAIGEHAGMAGWNMWCQVNCN